MKTILAKIWDYIRLVAAGCFFFVAFTVVAMLLSGVKWHVPFFVIGLGICIGFCLLLWSVFRFDGRSEPSVTAMNRKRVEELDREGKLDAFEYKYKARRAFEVEQLEDEGNHFYIELEDGSVLFLSGQYLWDYEPWPDEPRRFPCTEFTLKMISEQDVGKIECRGTPLEPDAVFPPFDAEDYEYVLMPDDLDIVKDVTYDELKQNRGRLQRREQNAKA